VLGNVRAIGQGVEVRPDDVTVCWLPLYHDMGLIGCWLFSLYFGLPIAVISPLAFLRRPERWLWMIHEHRGTLSPAPNFAYELCVRKTDAGRLEGLDLSSWRVALNGAEPVSAETLARFAERFGRYGFRPETLLPVYGLAEYTVALTFAPLGRRARIDAIQREAFVRTGCAVPAHPHEAAPLRFVSVGRPLAGSEVRIVDAAGQPVAERREGRLLFRGVSAMSGYFRNPEATAAVCCAGWYDSGDLAYQADGELFITGRSKDLIIKAGRNIYPHELEEVAGEVSGIRKGCVAAFGVSDPAHGTERVVLVAETRETRPGALSHLQAEVVRHLARLGHPADEVLLVPPQRIPKTPSGKLRRARCRQLYLRGELSRGRPPAWWQLLRLVVGTLVARWRRPLPG
jgi:acyl-CoA synthetase (AMP-forming)/AMP-acid ligase II